MCSGEPTGVFHVLETARQFTLRVGEGLAVFLGDQAPVRRRFDEELAQREEDVGALESEELRQPSAAPRAIGNDSSDELRVAMGTWRDVDHRSRRVEDE